MSSVLSYLQKGEIVQHNFQAYGLCMSIVNMSSSGL